MYQLTRDSLTEEDRLFAPHVVVVPLDPQDATLADLCAWLDAESYLPEADVGTEGEVGAWYVHLASREGEAVACLRSRRTPGGAGLEVVYLTDADLPLHGTGAIHLTHVARLPEGADR